jgi:tRNA-Thr(GGU) m(6)t(6)A37 methyltransferase TsaA
MEVVEIGRIKKTEDSNRIVIDERYAEGLSGIEQFSHIIVCYWLDRNDTPEKRSTLEVNPCHNEENPLTGVFATHSPLRPNPLAISIAELLSIEGLSLVIGEIDAFDDSPVIDIKGYFAGVMPREGVRSPEWKR